MARLQRAFGDFVQIVAVPPAREVAQSVRDLGAGEQQAIALALHARALLLVDDHAARVAALASGVSVTGTVGVVIRAKETRILAAVSSVLARMRANGYWLSDGLLAAAARIAGE